ncbi:MAG TPA: hypothetical protein VIJ51_18085 [Solirubrobacteraceae bacterium]
MVGALIGAGFATVGCLLPSSAPAAVQPSWSPAVSLVRCGSLGVPRVVFPASDPFHASGQGAILWSGDPADCNGADAAAGPGVGIAEFEPDHTLGAPELLPAAGSPPLTGLSAATATGDGRIVLAGGVGSAGGGTGELSQGPAAGPFTGAGGLGGPGAPIAVTSSYRGDVAIASVSAGGKIELRIEPHGTPSFSPPVVLTSRDAAVTALSVNLDYRGDAVVAWAEKGAIYVRVRAANGVLLTTQRVASSPPSPRLAALISDDNRAIVAWENDRTSVGDATTTTTAYLDISVPGIHFTGPHLLERFVDPPGLIPPASGLEMVRLAYEGVVVAWTGLSGGHFVVRAAPVSVNSIRPATTVSDPSADAMLSDLATGPKDEVIALWTAAPRSDGQPDAAEQRIISARGLSEPSGVARFAAPQLVAGPGLLSEPRVAIDPVTDVAVAVWRNRGGNPGIDYAVRGPSGSDTSVAGRPGPAQGARRAGSGGPSAVTIVVGVLVGLGFVLFGLRRRARARERRRTGLRSQGRRLTRRLNLTRWDS